jgi:hypothetical protein
MKGCGIELHGPDDSPVKDCRCGSKEPDDVRTTMTAIDIGDTVIVVPKVFP